MDTYYCKQDYFEWCSCCEKLYSVINRTQHLKSKKHLKKLFQLNITDSDIPVEKYSLTLIDEKDVD
jgi:hypothetical protein